MGDFARDLEELKGRFVLLEKRYSQLEKTMTKVMENNLKLIEVIEKLSAKIPAEVLKTPETK